jgi:hypothetical protein
LPALSPLAIGYFHIFQLAIIIIGWLFAITPRRFSPLRQAAMFHDVSAISPFLRCRHFTPAAFQRLPPLPPTPMPGFPSPLLPFSLTPRQFADGIAAC